MADPIDPEIAAEMLRHSTTYYTSAAETLVRDLRDMVDRVTRELQPADKASLSGTPRYAHAVQGAQNAIAWGMANAHVSHLVGAAARADAAEAMVAALGGTGVRP